VKFALNAQTFNRVATTALLTGTFMVFWNACYIVYNEMARDAVVNSEAMETFFAYKDGDQSKVNDLRSLATENTVAMELLMHVINEQNDGENANELVAHAFSNFNDMDLRNVFKSSYVSLERKNAGLLDLSKLDAGYLQQLRECKSKLDNRYARWGVSAPLFEVYLDRHSCRA